MATWPVLGQRGPQYWSDQLKQYVDALPSAVQAEVDAVEARTTTLEGDVGDIETTLNGRLSEAQLEALALAQILEREESLALPTPLDYLRARLARTTMGPVRAMILGSSTAFGSGATTASKSVTNTLTRLIQSAHPSGVALWEPPVLASSVADDFTPNLPGFHMANAAFGGAVSADYVGSSRATQATTIQPHVIIHLIGANDYRNGVPPATMQANITAAMASLDAVLTQPAVHVIVGTYAMPVETAPLAPWSGYLDGMEAAANAHSMAVFIDASKPFIEANASGPSAPDPLDLISTDQIHATDAGHALLAREIARRLDLPVPVWNTPEVLDRFTRKALGNAETGQAWAQIGGGVHIPDGTYLTCATAGNAAVDTGFTDAEVSSVVTFSTAALIGVMAKANSDASQRLFFGIHPTLGAGSTPVVVMYKAATLLTSVPLAGTASGKEYHLRFVASGSTLLGFLDGALVISNTLDGTDTTTYNANTRHGVRCNAATSARWRNFAVRRA